MNPRAVLLSMLAAGVGAFTAGCHSYHVDTTIENRTGGPIRLLEVDYPGGSFGANGLESGADFRYRIQLRGSGLVKIQYIAQNGSQKQSEGPALFEGQEGRLEIELKQEAPAEFRSTLRNRR